MKVEDFSMAIIGIDRQRGVGVCRTASHADFDWIIAIVLSDSGEMSVLFSIYIPRGQFQV